MSEQQLNINNDFINYTNKILTALDIPSDSNVLQEMIKFNDSEKYKIITNEKINNLLEADSKLFELGKRLENEPYYEQIKNQWNLMIKNLAKLQIYIFIKKIDKSNCGPLIEEIVKALDNKISIVNKIMEENIKSIDDENKQIINTTKLNNKYLKYKTKYLQIKNN